MATTGPMPMISGGTPPVAKLTKRAFGFRPSSLARVCRHHERHRRAVAGLRGVARRHRSMRVKHRLQLGQRFDGCVGARTFVFREGRFGGLRFASPFMVVDLDVTGTISSSNLPSACAFSAF